MDQLVVFLGEHYILTSLWVLLVVLIILSYVQAAASGSKTLTAAQATLMMNSEQAQIVDIRPAAEFNKGHILGAINLSLEKLDDAKSLEKYKSKPIIITCANGLQSGTAVLKLKKQGFTQVHKLQRGMQTWLEEKLPLHKS